MSRLPDEFQQRVKGFAAGIIRFFIKLPKGQEEVRVLGEQLLRSGTSAAAQVREASRAGSDAKYVSKLGGAIQEADEPALWLELLREECSIEPASSSPHETELTELIAIFTTMIKRTIAKTETLKSNS